jgi:hypothetical protein
VFRLLVVVASVYEPSAPRRAVRSRVAGRRYEVLVLAPVVSPPLHVLTESEHREETEANGRARKAVVLLDEIGIAARGEVGADDPLQAIGAALVAFPADEILLVARDADHRSWLKHRARDLFGVHVTPLIAS